MEQPPFPNPPPEASLTALNPSIIYTPTHFQPSTNSRDAGASPSTSDGTDPEHTSPTLQPGRLLPAASTKAHGPSAEPVETGHSPHLDYLRGPYPQRTQRPPHLQRPASSLRQRPYSQKGQRAGPTSAPSSAVFVTDERPAVPDDAEKYNFATYSDQTTLVMGVLVHLDALARQCEEMRTFIRTGFGDGNEVSNGAWSRIESTRLELRNWNRTHVTELDEILQPLPRSDDGEIPHDTPSTGRMVQYLDHAEIARLLDAYDLPFIPTMFLYEKKAIYLRFVGASRALMHRVLDERLSGQTSQKEED